MESQRKAFLMDRGGQTPHGEHECSICGARFHSITMSPAQNHVVGADFEVHLRHRHPDVTLRKPITDEVIRIADGKHHGRYAVKKVHEDRQKADVKPVDGTIGVDNIPWVYLSYFEKSK